MSPLVHIIGDEWYPVFDLASDGTYADRTIHVDQETLDRWRAAIAAFEAVQVEMRTAADWDKRE